MSNPFCIVDPEKLSRDGDLAKKRLYVLVKEFLDQDLQVWDNHKQEIINAVEVADEERPNEKQIQESIKPVNNLKVEDTRELQEYIVHSSEVTRFVSPNSEYEVWTMPRPAESRKKAHSLIESIKSNTLDCLWYDVFQNNPGKIPIMRSSTSKEVIFNVVVLKLLARQGDSLVLKCRVSDATTGSDTRSNIPCLQNNQQVCIKIQPRHKFTTFQVTTESSCLGDLWNLKEAIHGPFNNKPHPFPIPFAYTGLNVNGDVRAYLMVTDLFYKDLNEIIMNTQFSSYSMRWDMVRGALIKVIDCIDLLHSYGYVHLDVKPENVMYKSEGLTDLVLIDFGLSKKIWDVRKQTKHRYTFDKMTEARGQEGTPLCMDIRQHEANTFHHDFMYDLQAVAWSILWLMNSDKGPISRILKEVEARQEYKHDSNGEIYLSSLYEEKKKFFTDEPMEGHDEIVRLFVNYTMHPRISREYEAMDYKECKKFLSVQL